MTGSELPEREVQALTGINGVRCTARSGVLSAAGDEV
jgi:hypothetical protein